MTNTNYYTVWNRQKGTALMASLLMLLVITIISVTALKDTMMDDNMARNVQNDTIAFQAADGIVNKTRTLIQLNEEIPKLVRAAKEAQTEDPTVPNHTDSFSGISLSSYKTVNNGVVISQLPSANPNGTCANYDCYFAAHRFHIEGTAAVENTHASTTIVQDILKEPYLRDNSEIDIVIETQGNQTTEAQ